MNTIEELSLYVEKVQPVIGWPEWEADEPEGWRERCGPLDEDMPGGYHREYAYSPVDRRWEDARNSFQPHVALCLWREHCREQWSRRGLVVFEDYQDPDLRARQYVAYGPGAVLIGTFGTLAEANVAIAVMVAVWRLEHTE